MDCISLNYGWPTSLYRGTLSSALNVPGQWVLVRYVRSIQKKPQRDWTVRLRGSLTEETPIHSSTYLGVQCEVTQSTAIDFTHTPLGVKSAHSDLEEGWKLTRLKLTRLNLRRLNLRCKNQVKLDFGALQTTIKTNSGVNYSQEYGFVLTLRLITMITQ